ncbi:hypothetical protein C0992_005033 [Termitomyces sp. T32_za158]|nr:hypothetical protein C0992_005033 [Termitomyces sp. T32_za158]
MSSPSASTSLVSPAVLTAQAYVPKLDMFLASLTNVGPGANQKTVVGAMKTPAPPSIDEQLASLLADDGPFTLWTELSSDSKVAAYVKPLVQMDLARQERQWAEAAAQSAAIMSAEREAELLEEQRVALAKFLAKHTADAWVAGFLETVEPPTATTFTDAQLRNLLVPRQDEVVLDNNHCAGENVSGVKGKKTVLLAAHDNFKSLKGSSCKRGKVNPHLQRNFEKVVLVRRARAFVLEQRKLLVAGKAISISISSLALPTAQESGYVVDMVDLAPPTPKGKATAVSTPHKQRASTSGDKQPAKQSRSGTASRKGAKTVPCWEETPPVASPSQQIIPVDPVEPVLHPGGVVLSEPELPSEAEVPSKHEEEAELSDVSESLSEVPAVPRRAVQPNYAPLPTPRVNGQEFLWLGKALDYSISALHPSKYIEAAKEKAAGIAEVMRKDMRAAAVEVEGLRLRKRIIERSVDILERYQADCAEALEWREANETHLRQPYATLFPLPPGASLDP